MIPTGCSFNVGGRPKPIEAFDSHRTSTIVAVDGVHFNVRLEDDRFCTLVMIGVRPGGTKDLITVEDGHWENAESWKTVLRDLKRRGIHVRPGHPRPTHSRKIPVSDDVASHEHAWLFHRSVAKLDALPSKSALVPYDHLRRRIATRARVAVGQG
jgi:hypothetical protein